MAIHPSQCSSESIVDKCSNWSAIRLRPCKTHSTKLQVSVHGLVVQMFRSQVSTVVISTNSSHLDVAIDQERRCNRSVGVTTSLIRPAPRRIAMARPVAASSLISRLRLSTTSPDPFALSSTPCCSKITPRSRIIETQPVPAAAALTAVEFSFSTREDDNRLCC